jgi:AFG3 family protein
MTAQHKNKMVKKNKNNEAHFLQPKFYWIYIVLFLMLFIFQFFGDQKPKEISWNEFEQTMLQQEDVEKLMVVNKEFVEVFIKPEKLDKEQHQGTKKKQWNFSSRAPNYSFTIGSIDAFERKLEAAQDNKDAKNKVVVQYVSRKDWLAGIMSWILPLAIMLFFWVFIIGRLSKSSGGAMGSLFNFGKSKATLVDYANKKPITFEDVAGLEEAKVEVKEVVDFLKSPEEYTQLGAKIPKGVILVGPPGTGKTLIAKAVAGEAGVPVFTISGSNFVEMFVGVGASRVRDLFKQAKAKSPCIIFIDEIDAIGRARGKAAAFGGNDERENTLNQLLSEMDGFGTNTGVIVLAATNRADILDEALLRPGRFDRHIYLELPNLNERKAIFAVHVRPLKMNTQVDLVSLAAQTPGFSGADIANVCNEAALIAARRKKNKIEQTDFLAAIDRIVAGLERKSKIISAEERKIIAYHEAGHAVVSWYLKKAAPLIKVTIIPRGKSLGAAWYLPEERQIKTQSQFEEELCVALGGRVAEEIIFREVSSGALDDLEKVTKQAYAMVALYGFDEKIGNISFYDSTGSQENALQKPYSESTGELIDQRVRNLVNDAHDRTRTLLNTHHKELKELAETLLNQETVHQKQLEKILGLRDLNNNFKVVS